jgi:hypothetical protein
MAGGIDREELRKLVREVLRSSVAEGAAPPVQSPNLLDAMRQAMLPGQAGIVAVGEDLNHFAQAILHASAQEDLKAAIMSGRLKFAAQTGSRPPGRRPPDNPVARGGEFRLDKGMLSETRIAEIGKRHTKIVVGPEVVVTPLARDRARELKLELVRSKS